MIDPNKLLEADSVAFPDILSDSERMLAELHAELAILVFERRKKLNLTQSAFAGKYGLSQSMISKIENGEDGISLRAMLEVLSKLGFELKITEPMSTASEKVIAFPSERANKYKSSRSAENMYHVSSYRSSEEYLREM